MKYFFFFLALYFALNFCSQTRIFEKLRLLSTECSNHGYLFKGKCFCQSQYSGQTCEKSSKTKK